MERLIDKLILYVFAVCAFIYDGSAKPLLIYLTLSVSAAMIWLIPVNPENGAAYGYLKGRNTEEEDVGDRKIRLRGIVARILLDAAVVLLFFYPELMGILPVLVYDLMLCRHIPGLALSAVVLVNGVARGYSGGILWIVLILSALAVWLCYGTMRREADRNRIRKLRDDAVEKQQTLSLQNEQLLSARDSEVVAAQLAERNRIAREIHDNVGHTLSRALLQVGALLAVHKEEPTHTELTGVRETLDGAMTSIRTSVHDLHDSSVKFADSVRQIAAPLEEEFQVRLEIDVSENMPGEKKYGLIGILREAVANILHHSRNDSVQISLMEHPAFYQMIVYDYLSPGGTRKSQPVTGKESGVPGIGLTNIETRVRSMGGSVQITNENGFRVFVSIPK